MLSETGGGKRFFSEVGGWETTITEGFDGEIFVVGRKTLLFSLYISMFTRGTMDSRC
jgi:hypothetical protein